MPFHQPPAAGSLGCLGHCWRLHPACGHIVSGDALFAEIGRSDHKTLFLLVDVTDHGPAAHRIVCHLADPLLRDATCANLRPAELLHTLHGMLEPVWLDTHKFVAAVALLVDGSGAVEASAAGVPFPMRRTPCGPWGAWEIETAPPLGFPAGLPYKPSSLLLTPGDHLLAFTDGLTEARNHADQQYDQGPFAQFLQGQAVDAAGAPLLDALLNDVRNHAGAAWPKDDTTILCLWHPFPRGLG